MKKFTLGLVILCVIFFLTGCGSKTSNTANEELIAEIRETLDQNDAQVLIAFGDSYEAKKDLIHSSELHSDGLIALCTNPKPLNLKNLEVQSWFIDAIERTELTAEQEVRIAKIGKYAYSQALLLSSHLTSDGLVAVCENPGDLNIKNYQVQEWLMDAIERTELTSEQEVRIAKIGKIAYSQALLLSTHLTSDGLVAVCENPGDLNLKNNQVQKWFKDAIKRTELTAKQKVLIANSKIGGLGLF